MRHFVVVETLQRSSDHFAKRREATLSSKTPTSMQRWGPDEIHRVGWEVDLFCGIYWHQPPEGVPSFLRDC